MYFFKKILVSTCLKSAVALFFEAFLLSADWRPAVALLLVKVRQCLSLLLLGLAWVDFMHWKHV